MHHKPGCTERIGRGSESAKFHVFRAMFARKTLGLGLLRAPDASTVQSREGTVNISAGKQGASQTRLHRTCRERVRIGLISRLPCNVARKTLGLGLLRAPDASTVQSREGTVNISAGKQGASQTRLHRTYRERVRIGQVSRLPCNVCPVRGKRPDSASPTLVFRAMFARLTPLRVRIPPPKKSSLTAACNFWRRRRDVRVFASRIRMTSHFALGPQVSAGHLRPCGFESLLRKKQPFGCFWDSGGGGGIRTLVTPEGQTVFETAAFNHSATPP